jgi:hypothetical protein
MTDAPSLANLWAIPTSQSLVAPKQSFGEKVSPKLPSGQRRAIASPMPAHAPVIMATFPSQRLSTFQPRENLVKNSESTSPFEF